MTQLEHMHPALLGLVGKMLQDDHAVVAGYSVLCLTAILPFLDERHVDLVRGLLAPSLGAIRNCLAVDEALACRAMDILEECADSDAGFLRAFITDLCMFCLQVSVRGDG